MAQTVRHSGGMRTGFVNFGGPCLVVLPAPAVAFVRPSGGDISRERVCIEPRSVAAAPAMRAATRRPGPRLSAIAGREPPCRA